MDHAPDTRTTPTTSPVMPLARPAAAPWLPPVPAGVRRGSRTVAVVGACGGAGTSTLAAGVAHGLRRSGEGGVLVDLDAPGGGLDVLLGVEDEAGARWPELADARGDVDGAGLLAALPRWRSVPVLSASRRHAGAPDDAVVVDVCTGLLGAGESVVLDLPRPNAWSPAVRLLVAAADQVLLVVPCTVPGVASAVAACAALRDAQANDPWAVARGPAAGRVDAAAVQSALGVAVVAELRWDRRLAEAVGRGEGPPVGRRTPLGRAAAELLDVLADVPAEARSRSLTGAS